MTTPTANDILMSGGGSFVSFKNHGDTVTGTIINVGEPVQLREWNQQTQRSDGPPKFTKAGKPVYGFHLTLSTTERDITDPEDDGTRIVDVNSWRMQDALRNAIRGAGSRGLEVGAQVSISYVGDEVPGDSRSGKKYTASYSNPANTVLMNSADPNTGEIPAAAAPAPVPVAPPVQAAPVSAPAPAAVPADDPVAKARQLIAAGVDDATIAQVTALDPVVLNALRNAA